MKNSHWNRTKHEIGQDKHTVHGVGADVQATGYPVKNQAPLQQCDENSSIGRDEISLTEDIKLLGVTPDKDLNFDKHIADIARKVDNQMRVLQRYKKLIDTDAKIGLYNAYLLLHLDYRSIEWHHCGRRNSNKLEKLNWALFIMMSY